MSNLLITAELNSSFYKLWIYCLFCLNLIVYKLNTHKVCQLDSFAEIPIYQSDIEYDYSLNCSPRYTSLTR